jgi:Uma2 family endonuclease
VEKLKEYAAFGVRWYWIIEPELRSAQILELGPDGRYTIVVSAADGIIDVPGCDGLTLNLDALWREVDLLEEGEG